MCFYREKVSLSFMKGRPKIGSLLQWMSIFLYIEKEKNNISHILENICLNILTRPG